MSDVNLGGAVEGAVAGSGELSAVGTPVVVPPVGQVATTPVVATLTQTAVVTKPVRAKAKAKAKATKVVAKDKTRGRGRPPKYTGKLAEYIAKLVNDYGASRAMDILNAAGRDNVNVHNKSLRNLKLVPEALGISMPTILKIAHAAGIELHPGRPAQAA